jgi:hypothetical protein
MHTPEEREGKREKKKLLGLFNAQHGFYLRTHCTQRSTRLTRFSSKPPNIVVAMKNFSYEVVGRSPHVFCDLTEPLYQIFWELDSNIAHVSAPKKERRARSKVVLEEERRKTLG